MHSSRPNGVDPSYAGPSDADPADRLLEYWRKGQTSPAGLCALSVAGVGYRSTGEKPKVGDLEDSLATGWYLSKALGST